MNHIAIVLVAVGLVMMVAFLAAAAAGTLARLDGATYPAAIMRAATTFAAVLTLAAAVTGALAQMQIPPSPTAADSDGGHGHRVLFALLAHLGPAGLL